jgi:hypothetical protein
MSPEPRIPTPDSWGVSKERKLYGGLGLLLHLVLQEEIYIGF